MLLCVNTSTTLLYLQLIHSMIMPAVDMRDTESNEFQVFWYCVVHVYFS